MIYVGARTCCSQVGAQCIKSWQYVRDGNSVYREDRQGVRGHLFFRRIETRFPLRGQRQLPLFDKVITVIFISQLSGVLHMTIHIALVADSISVISDNSSSVHLALCSQISSINAMTTDLGHLRDSNDQARCPFLLVSLRNYCSQCNTM